MNKDYSSVFVEIGTSDIDKFQGMVKGSHFGDCTQQQIATHSRKTSVSSIKEFKMN
jgi:hypothetical protein